MRTPIFLVFLLTTLAAQEAQPLEALRETALAQVKSMRTAFDNDLALALRIWADVPVDEESPALTKANTALTQWVPGFAGVLIEALGKQSNPLVHQRMLNLLCASASAELLPHARLLLNDARGPVRTNGIILLGSLGNADDAKLLAAKLSATPEPAPEECAHILQSLASLKAPEAATAARARTNHAKPEVRLAAFTALGALHLAPREEIPLFAKAIEEDADMAVRTGALRALAGYGEHLDALKTLHAQVSGNDPQLAAAALDALERSANKETSRTYLMEAVNGIGALAFKERCARLLARLGDPRGARLLTKGARDTAAAAPRDADAQIAAGDQVKRLGAYADAIDFYRKAVDLLKAGQKYRARVPWARVLAVQGKFEDAWELLKPDYRNLNGFADDADFADMRRNPRWAPLFTQSN